MFFDLGDVNTTTNAIIASAIEIHRTLGPGLLEAVYTQCLEHEFRQRKVAYARQVAVPIRYKGEDLGTPYRLDLLVGEQVVVEVKAVEKVERVHRSQLLTYLRLTGKPVGLLLNFNEPTMREGIERLLNTKQQ